MTSTNARFGIALAGALLSSAVVLAQGPRTAAAPAAGLTVVQSVIAGTVLDASSRPIPNARVQLRNLETTRVDRTGFTNRLGEFSFPVVPDVSYVVELVDENGRVLAAGPMLSARPGEVAGTIVKLRSATATAVSTFTYGLGTLLSAVASLGITSLDTDPPVSPVTIDTFDTDPPLSPEK